MDIAFISVPVELVQFEISCSETAITHHRAECASTATVGMTMSAIHNRSRHSLPDGALDTDAGSAMAERGVRI